MRITGLLIVILTLVAGFGTAVAADDRAPAVLRIADSEFVVYCYDPAREVVTRQLAAQCHGTVVSEQKAKEVEERRNQQIAKALKGSQRPAPEGARLARLGTAFFVDDNGRLLTNNHVIDGCKAVGVETASGDSLPAKVLAVDVQRDLAILQVSIRSPAVAEFRTQPLAEVGAPVTTIGFPDEGIPARQPSATPGTLMSPPKGASWGDRLLVKADIRHGDSGGPVLDRYGLVVGVMRAKVDTVANYRRTGEVISDVGIGIAAQTLFVFLRANAISFRTAQQGDSVGAFEMLQTARPYIARVDCWL